MTTVLKWCFCILTCWLIASQAFRCRDRLWIIGAVYRRFRPKIFLESVAVFTGVVVFYAWLRALSPIFGYGWGRLVFGDDTNVMMAPASLSSTSTSVGVQVFGIVFLAALILLMPLLTRAEELSFRKGHERWRSILRQSVVFGLMHCVVGVPLAVGVALIPAGLFFAYKYKRTYDSIYDPHTRRGHFRGQKEAVMVSTVYHTMHNTIACGLGFALAVGQLAKQF